MTIDKSIYIKNIYYMLSYAFQALRQNNYRDIETEPFENTQDLFAAIISRGVAQQVKQGLYREYISKSESLSVLRGKLDIHGTIAERVQHRQRAVCEYDELSADNLLNQVLKTTMVYLTAADGVAYERKMELKKLLVFFDEIAILTPTAIPWARIQYRRDSQNYKLLVNLCYFVLHDMLLTTDTGSVRMAEFSEDNMAKLYEHFLLEYYRKEHPELTDVRAAKVDWNLQGDNNTQFLPDMQTDVMLKKDGKTLVIDAKYYGHILQHRFDKWSIHSANMYQIYAYVKNLDIDNSGNVAGLLLYAKTDEEVVPDCVYNMAGNYIGAKTLDLNKDFKLIAQQLDKIADEYFGKMDVQSTAGKSAVIHSH